MKECQRLICCLGKRVWLSSYAKVKEDELTQSNIIHRTRSIYWLKDTEGGAGKSEFIKWLRVRQKKLICRKLPIDSVDRLQNAGIDITKKGKIYVFMIDNR